MANPPTFPSDGRITSLQNYSSAFTGGELFPIVAPGNATAGINYNINASTLAAGLLPIFPSQPVGQVFATNNGIPAFTNAPVLSSSIVVPFVYGGTAAGAVLNLYGTNNGSPLNDDVNINSTNLFFYPDKVAGQLNNASLSYGTGPNGEGIAFSMVYRNRNGSAPVSTQELGYWQQYAWDGTQQAPTGNPPAVVFIATETWNATSHGTNIFFQTIPAGTANGLNEFAVGNGVTALASGDSGATQGLGQGTFNARNPNGYYIQGGQVISVSGNYVRLFSPSVLSGAAIFLGNVNDPQTYLRGNTIIFQNLTGGTSYLSCNFNEIQPLPDAAVALGDGTHRWISGNFVNLTVSTAVSAGGLSVGTTTAPNTGDILQTGKENLLSGIPLSATATAAILMSSVPNFGVYCGTGVPVVSAGTGSLYLRNDGATATTRMYINQNGSTTWTAVTTQA